MSDQARPPRRISITARLDALEFKLRADMASLELRVLNALNEKIDALDTKLSAKFDSKIGGLDTRLTALALDFKEFKGYAKGVAIVMTTLVPVATALTVAGLNYWLLRSNLPLR